MIPGLNIGIRLNQYATNYDSILESRNILGSINIKIGIEIKDIKQIKFSKYMIIPGINLYCSEKPIIMNGIHIYNAE